MSYRTTSEPPVEGRPGLTLETPTAEPELPSGDEPEGEGGESQPAEPELAGGWTQRQWSEAAEHVDRSAKDWFETSVQPIAARNYAHFQSRHAPGSKYLTDYFRLRSQVFRGKTRAMVRRSEAAVAVALFSTSDLLDVDAWDDTNQDQKDAAEIAKAILQYRFERTIPWFQTMVGAAQEACIHGRPIAHIHWRYRTRKRRALQMDDAGKVDWADDFDVIEDKPAVDLVALENLRIDPACDWRDPINSSPYAVHDMPMYVGDVKAMATSANAMLGQKWYIELDDATWWQHASATQTNVLRSARQGQQSDPLESQRGSPDAEIIWVKRFYMRRDGVDYMFDKLGDLMLSTPRDVESVYPHLEPATRPYVMGTSAIEAFKVYPTSPAGMVDESQREINELANLNIDGLRMAIMSRWLKRRGASIDTELLKYGAANSVITVDDVQQDVKELRQSDVPPSAFATLDRSTTSFDEITGNFSLGSVANNRNMNETVGGMNLLSADAGQVKEYEIRTFVETFVEPVINQVYALEQVYETDKELLNDVAVRTGLPLERVLDLLAMRVRVRVNVGFNSTSPERRIQRIALCVKTVTELDPEVQQGLNTAEIVKEVFGAAGYKNGARFWSNPQGGSGDPEKDRLMQENQQLKAQLAGQTAQAQSRVQVANIQMQGRLKQAAMDNQTRERIATMQAQLQTAEIRLQHMDRQLAAGSQDIDRMRLVNERDALSNSIQNDKLRLFSELMGMNGGVDDAGGKVAGGPGGERKGPPDMPGHDNAGTLAREKYGLIPFEQS